MSVATLKDFWQPSETPVTTPTPPPVKAPSTCAKTGKIRMATKQEAQVELKRLTRVQPDEVRNAYRCWSCGDWHLGHSK